MRALVLVGVAAAGHAASAAPAPAAPAPVDTFEAKASGALPVRRLDDLVWALTAPCDRGDDTEQRQCRTVRDARAAELAGSALLVDADADAFAVGAWSDAKKSIALTLSACIRCAGLQLDGKTWFVTGAVPRIDGGKLAPPLLYDNARTFPDQAAAKQWATQVSAAKVQLVVKVPGKPRWTVDGKSGLALDVLAFRVYTPCDHVVIVAKPPSGALDLSGDDCGPPLSPDLAAQPEVEHLSSSMIRDAMAPAVAAAHKCFARYGVAGTAKLELTIADGAIAKYEQVGDFVGTPTGACIDAAAKPVRFPRSHEPRQTITYPIILP